MVRLKTIENFIDEYKIIDPTISTFRDKFINARNLYKTYAQDEINLVGEQIKNFNPRITNMINCNKLMQFLDPYLKFCGDHLFKRHHIENSIKSINKIIYKGGFN